MTSSLLEKIAARRSGICLYGLVPPKQATPAAQLEAIVARQLERLRSLAVDGFVIYDVQDEPGRTPEPRPFPFLPTIDPETYACECLELLAAPKVVYRCVQRDTPSGLARWLEEVNGAIPPRISVFVGAAHRRPRGGVSLADAYALARKHAPHLVLGGIAIAERHARDLAEHERILAKADNGCRFFVTQAVYDVTSTKSLLSDVSLACRARNEPAAPIILTFSPCGSEKTLAFMKWLGIAFPRWLENDLRTAADPLATSLELCDRIFSEVWDYARDHSVPLGVNVESISIRKVEIEASVELLRRLQKRMGRASGPPGES